MMMIMMMMTDYVLDYTVPSKMNCNSFCLALYTGLNTRLYIRFDRDTNMTNKYQNLQTFGLV